MSPSLDGTLPESVIYIIREQLSIDFARIEFHHFWIIQSHSIVFGEFAQTIAVRFLNGHSCSIHPISINACGSRNFSFSPFNSFKYWCSESDNWFYMGDIFNPLGWHFHIFGEKNLTADWEFIGYEKVCPYWVTHTRKWRGLHHQLNHEIKNAWYTQAQGVKSQLEWVPDRKCRKTCAGKGP